MQSFFLYFQEACQNIFAQEERGRRLSVSLAYFFHLFLDVILALSKERLNLGKN